MFGVRLIAFRASLLCIMQPRRLARSLPAPVSEQSNCNRALPFQPASGSASGPVFVVPIALFGTSAHNYWSCG